MDSDGASAWRFSSIICWLVILAAVVAMTSTREVQLSRLSEEGASLPEELGIEMAGRIAVGVKALTEQLAPKARWEHLNIAAQTAADYPIRTAILYGEVIGARSALEHLKSPMPPGKEEDAATLRLIYSGGADTLSSGQRRELSRRYGWFAELALTHGQSRAAPARAAALRPAIIAAWTMVGLLVIGSLALIVGLVLLVLAILFFTGGTARSRYRPDARPSGKLLEAFAIYLGGLGLVLLGIERFWPAAPFALRAVIYLALPFAAFWPLLRGVSWATLRNQLGWHAGSGFIREIFAGVAGYIAALPLLLVGLFISGFLIRASGQQSMHPIIRDARGNGLILLGVYLLACVWAPLAEESLFRGALYSHLRGRWGWIGSALLVAVIFAIIHPQGWVALPVLGTFAFASASIREWRGSIIGCMTAHALNNGCAITLLVLMLR